MNTKNLNGPIFDCFKPNAILNVDGTYTVSLREATYSDNGEQLCVVASFEVGMELDERLESWDYYSATAKSDPFANRYEVTRVDRATGDITLMFMTQVNVDGEVLI